MQLYAIKKHIDMDQSHTFIYVVLFKTHKKINVTKRVCEPAKLLQRFKAFKKKLTALKKFQKLWWWHFLSP